MENRLVPFGGIDNINNDTVLQVGENSVTYLREALNVDILPSGEVRLRHGAEIVTEKPYQYLWQSPLHGDVFALLGMDWIKVNTDDWSHEVIAAGVGISPLYHEVLNNKVIMSNLHGIWQYDGKQAMPLTIPTPAPPILSEADGSLPSGDYSIAVSSVRVDGTESALSDIAHIHIKSGGILATPLNVFDSSVKSINVYMTAQNGETLQLAQTVDIGQQAIFSGVQKLGRMANFMHLSPMKAGKYLCYWQGRIWTASVNVLRFSESMAYHLHDERHGFVMMPQRITFVIAVDGGLWIGQSDHVAFLSGSNPNDFVLTVKSTAKPIPDSAIKLPHDSTADIGGEHSALWLCENGYVAGTPNGQTVAHQAKHIQGITANSGVSVRFKGKALTTVN